MKIKPDILCTLYARLDVGFDLPSPKVTPNTLQIAENEMAASLCVKAKEYLITL